MRGIPFDYYMGWLGVNRIDRQLLYVACNEIAIAHTETKQ